MSKPHVHIYTCGWAQPNPGASGIGAVLALVGKEYERSLSEPVGHGSNNRAELLAAIAGLHKLTMPCRVTLYSSSQWFVKCATGEWGRNSHIDLWAAYEDVIAAHEVSVEWCKRDSEKRNRQARLLAQQAADANAA